MSNSLCEFCKNLCQKPFEMYYSDPQESGIVYFCSSEHASNYYDSAQGSWLREAMRKTEQALMQVTLTNRY